MNRHIPHKPAFVFLVCLALLLFSCKDGGKQHVARPQHDILPETQAKKDLSLLGNFSTQTNLQFDSSSIGRFIQKYPLFKPLSGDIHKFYASRHFAYAWYDKNGLVEQASKTRSPKPPGPRKIPVPEQLQYLSARQSGENPVQ